MLKRFVMVLTSRDCRQSRTRDQLPQSNLPVAQLLRRLFKNTKWLDAHTVEGAGTARPSVNSVGMTVRASQFSRTAAVVPTGHTGRFLVRERDDD